MRKPCESHSLLFPNQPYIAQVRKAVAMPSVILWPVHNQLLGFHRVPHPLHLPSLMTPTCASVSLSVSTRTWPACNQLLFFSTRLLPLPHLVLTVSRYSSAVCTSQYKCPVARLFQNLPGLVLVPQAAPWHGLANSDLLQAILGFHITFTGLLLSH